MEEVLTSRVEGLAFGGQGIVRHEGLVIFVPFTAPGDLIRFQILTKKKNFAQGQLVEVIEKSSVRVTPPCPYFGSCGGCQLQHMSYDAQLDYKQQTIQDALQRIAKIPEAVVLPVQAAKQRWDYRRRIALTLHPHEEGFIAGYLGVDNQSLVTVDQCAIFIPQENPLIKNVQTVVSQLNHAKKQKGKVLLLKQEDERYLLHFQFEFLPPNIHEIMEKSLATFSNWSGILVTTRHKKLTFGVLNPTLNIDGLKFSFSPQAFIQNHPEQSLSIYRSIVNHAKNLNANNILDLYCGIGISTLLLANQGFKVTGVETNEEAVNRAQKNAADNNLSQKVQFIKADVQNILGKLLKREHAQLIIVNPPRTGLDSSVVQALLKEAPPSILYISCMPPTLARDLKPFTENGYELRPVEAYDMFPQTAHVETLALLQRK
jgi:23S rRNA (uracil1939-C5)-methyltransferase